MLRDSLQACALSARLPAHRYKLTSAGLLGTNFPPAVDPNGLLPCTFGGAVLSPVLQIPGALTLVMPPSVFEMPSVSLQNLNDHVQRPIATKHYIGCSNCVA
jgi:hypothetical protein